MAPDREKTAVSSARSVTSSAPIATDADDTAAITINYDVGMAGRTSAAPLRTLETPLPPGGGSGRERACGQFAAGRLAQRSCIRARNDAMRSTRAFSASRTTAFCAGVNVA